VTIENVDYTADQIGGKLKMSEDVIATIAGIAARQIPGIHTLGKSRFIPFASDDLKRGIAAEVGDYEVALQVEVIINYGSNIRQVAAELRRKIAEEIDRMAGRKVIEVDISVVGIHRPEENPPEPPRRVR
jgi:uncharacterized alkaline shock family protein YloU